MFDNPGDKIKTVAIILFVLGIIGSIVEGAILISNKTETVGILLILGGPVLSWVVALLVYGFGDLVENNAYLAEETERQSEKKQKKHEYKSKPAEKKDKRPVSPDKSEKDSFVVKTPHYEVSERKDYSLEEANFIEIFCPNCFEQLSFPEAEVMGNEKLTCPYCLEEIKYR